jgi:hypothetical protein
MPAKGQSETAAARRIESLRYRQAGKSYRTIGTLLGISEAQAWRDVKTELRKLARMASGEANALRELESSRLDVAIATVFEIIQAEPPDLKTLEPVDALRTLLAHSELALKAIDRLIKLSERRAKLYGLDNQSEDAGPVIVKVTYGADDSDSSTEIASGTIEDTEIAETV